MVYEDKIEKQKKWAPEGWSYDEWESFFNDLEQLSLEELKEIADAGEIKFFHPDVRKDEYLSVIDEGDKEKMLNTYKEILSRKK